MPLSLPIWYSFKGVKCPTFYFCTGFWEQILHLTYFPVWMDFAHLWTQNIKYLVQMFAVWNTPKIHFRRTELLQLVMLFFLSSAHRLLHSKRHGEKRMMTGKEGEKKTEVSNSFFTVWKFHKVVWGVTLTQYLNTDLFPCSTSRTAASL